MLADATIVKGKNDDVKMEENEMERKENEVRETSVSVPGCHNLQRGSPRDCQLNRNIHNKPRLIIEQYNSTRSPFIFAKLSSRTSLLYAHH